MASLKQYCCKWLLNIQLFVSRLRKHILILFSYYYFKTPFVTWQIDFSNKEGVVVYFFIQIFFIEKFLVMRLKVFSTTIFYVCTLITCFFFVKMVDTSFVTLTTKLSFSCFGKLEKKHQFNWITWSSLDIVCFVCNSYELNKGKTSMKKRYIQSLRWLIFCLWTNKGKL